MLYLDHVDPRVQDYFADWMDFAFTGIVANRETLGVIDPNIARQHFLFYTAMDALCFCHFYRQLLKNPGSNVFSAIGFNPCTEKLRQLKLQFPNARTIGVFDNTVLGRVLDCKVVLAHRKQEVSFVLIDGAVLFSYKGKDFVVPEAVFSLHRFRVLTGIRSNYRAIKPKGAISFAQLFAQQTT